MKVTLTFDTEHDGMDAYLDAINGAKYKCQIEEIWEKCFRRNNKHGYDDPTLDSDQAYVIIENIAKIYLDIVNED